VHEGVSTLSSFKHSLPWCCAQLNVSPALPHPAGVVQGSERTTAVEMSRASVACSAAMFCARVGQSAQAIVSVLCVAWNRGPASSCALPSPNPLRQPSRTAPPTRVRIHIGTPSTSTACAVQAHTRECACTSSPTILTSCRATIAAFLPLPRLVATALVLLSHCACAKWTLP
jgi:hypothetical protein